MFMHKLDQGASNEYPQHVFIEKYMYSTLSGAVQWYRVTAQGQVVQNIVRLTGLLMTNTLTVVGIKGIFKYTDIFAAKVSSFCNAKATHIFSAKNIMHLPYFKIEILTSR